MSLSRYSTKKGVRWGYNFVKDNKKHQKKSFCSKREAKAAEAECRRLIEITPSTDITFKELCDFYLDNSITRNTEEWYKDKKSRIENKYLPFVWKNNLLKDFKLSKITAQIIEAFIRSISTSVSNNSANRDLVVLRTIFNYAIENDFLIKNPAKKVDILPTIKNQKYIPDIQDIKKVMIVLSEERQDQVIIINSLLARSNEVLSRLTWDDVDFKNKTVTLYTRKARNGDLRAQKKKMRPEAYGILYERFIKRDLSIPNVFYNKKTGKPFTDRHWFKKACIKAGIKPFGIHTLRHLTASVMLSEGGNIKKVQECLGHTNIKTTQIYTHDLQADEFDNIIEGITKIEKGESEKMKKEPCDKTAKVPNI